jgi:hypothetical protein
MTIYQLFVDLIAKIKNKNKTINSEEIIDEETTEQNVLFKTENGAKYEEEYENRDDEKTTEIDDLLKKEPTFRSQLIVTIRLIIESLLIGGFAYLLAVLLDDVGFVFSFIGSTASIFTSYIFPCLFYIKLSKHRFYHFKSIFAFGLMFFGLFFGLFVSTNVVYKAVVDNNNRNKTFTF